MRKTFGWPTGLFGLRTGIRLGIVGKPCKIIHTGFQCKGQSLCLVKGQITDALFQFGIVALINAGQAFDILLRIMKRASSIF